jgi:hypothetical protein
VGELHQWKPDGRTPFEHSMLVRGMRARVHEVYIAGTALEACDAFDPNFPDMERRMEQALLISRRRGVEMRGLDDATNSARYATVDAIVDLFPTTEESIDRLCIWAFDILVDHNRRRIAQTVLTKLVQRGNATARMAVARASQMELEHDLPDDASEYDAMPRTLRALIDILTDETYVSPGMYAAKTLIPIVANTMYRIGGDEAVSVMMPILQEGRRTVRAMASRKSLEITDSLEDDPFLNFISMYGTLLVGLAIEPEHVHEEIEGLLGMVERGSEVGASFAASSICDVVRTALLASHEVDRIVRRLLPVMFSGDVHRGGAILSNLPKLIEYAGDEVAWTVRTLLEPLQTPLDKTGDGDN